MQESDVGQQDNLERARKKQHTAQRNAMRTESQTMECMSIVTGVRRREERGEERGGWERGDTSRLLRCL